jgi:hypothetical protein
MMLRAIWIMDGIAAIIIALRLVSSGFVLRKVTLPDWLMISALLFGISNNACITVSEQHGLGRHIMYLEPAQIVTALKWQTIAEPLGIMSPTMGRLSFTIYMLRLVGCDKFKRYLLRFCIYFNLLVNILCIILIFVQCGPYVTAIWDTHAPGASHCWSKQVQSQYGYFQGACNTLIDLTLTVLPAWVVWNLKLSRNIKLGLVVLLGLSLFAAVASIVKTVKLESIGAGGDITYNLIPFVIWFTVENNVVIAAASIPTIKPLFSRKRAGYGYGSYSLSGSCNRNGHGDRSGVGGYNPKRLRSLDHSQSQSHAEVTADDRRFGGGRGIVKETTLTQTFVDEEGDRYSREDSEAELAGGIARAV